MPTNIVLQDYVALQAAADEMGLSYRLAYSYVQKGVFPSAKKIRGTRWYLHRRDINAWLTGQITSEGIYRS
jgi:predicted DNA-binding transcriptional regulator AlpA